jgi:hypothetical protein
MKGLCCASTAILCDISVIYKSKPELFCALSSVAIFGSCFGGRKEVPDVVIDKVKFLAAGHWWNPCSYNDTIVRSIVRYVTSIQ